MGLVVFLAVVGALTIYAFHTLFDASASGFIVAVVLFILGMNASDRFRTDEHKRVIVVQLASRLMVAYGLLL